MSDLPAIKTKLQELNSLLQTTMSTCNPEDSAAKIIQKMVAPNQKGCVNIQISSVIGQQIIFNLSMCSQIINEVEKQIDCLAVIEPGESLEDIKRKTIELALERNNFIQKDAAKELGISKRSILYAIDKYGINHQGWCKQRSRA